MVMEDRCGKVLDILGQPTVALRPARRCFTVGRRSPAHDPARFDPVTARLALALACILAAVAVGAGAFGAHALKSRLSPDLLVVWQTAVLYHALHALALFGTGLVLLLRPDASGARVAAWLFVVGIGLFSGSLYALVLSGVRTLGAVTPVGGVALIAGWLVLAWAVWSQP
jgi:uncharacterized membrane protein YgdD (TMEM256/DUF423 family)